MAIDRRRPAATGCRKHRREEVYDTSETQECVVVDAVVRERVSPE